MQHQQAVQALSAMAHEGRLALFRYLVQSMTEMSAGDLATALAMPSSTLSFHLKALTQAGLVQARHEGRFMYYSPHRSALNELLVYLTENCCGGSGCPTTELGAGECSSAG
ncbi:MAG: helix-turn-helix transcriptional regulator [Gammaproteobacteria bacterium]|nr:helix-turn-helix transcriptional regulator [Gammaproteobacteria bacterium]